MHKLKHSSILKSKHSFLFSNLKSVYSGAMLNIENNEEQQRLELATRLKEAIDSLPRGGKVRIAKACDISPTAITGWLKNGRIDKTNIAIVASITAYDLNWLISGKGDKHAKPLSLPQPSEQDIKLGGFDLWDDETPLLDDEVALPFFREVELSAGSGKHQVEENHGRKLRFAKSTLKKSNVNHAAAACVTVSGTSMEPVLPDGSVVGIDTSNKTIIDGKPYAINYHGDLLVKRVYKLPGGGFRLNSYNSAEYPDIYCAGDTLTDVLILGKVFWSSQLW